MPLKVIQGHRFWYQSKAHVRFPKAYTDGQNLDFKKSKIADDRCPDIFEVNILISTEQGQHQCRPDADWGAL